MPYPRKPHRTATLPGIPSYWEPTLADEIDPVRLHGSLGNICIDEKKLSGEAIVWRRSYMLQDFRGHLRGQALYQVGRDITCNATTYAPGTSKVLVDLLLGIHASHAVPSESDSRYTRMLRFRIGRVDLRFDKIESKASSGFWAVRWDEQRRVSRSPGIELAYRAIVGQFDPAVWRARVTSMIRRDNRPGSADTAQPREWAVLEICRMGPIDLGEGERIDGFNTFEAAREFARRRTRESIEGCRRVTDNEGDHRREWLDSGSDYVVIGTGADDFWRGDRYAGSDEFDDFIANPARPEDIQWEAFLPARKLSIESRTEG